MENLELFRFALGALTGHRLRSTLSALGVAIGVTEAVLLATGGGVAGLALGAGAIRAFVGIYPSFPASPPAWAVASALGLSLAVGVGFGVWPARRATRLDPVAALAKR
ncbi:MAG: hypothetical protein A2Y78_12935 [Acidobacteria bacterium RBG_13_68_16]|nr:MAG: hypothetical protein A2Y78_12935 [Acidobacteria bacterium RBG_13_68_16]